MKLRSVTIATLSDDADGICASQNPSGAGNLTINGALATGGVATLAAAQKVTITSAGNDTAITFTITGTDADGVTISEAVTGANASTAKSTKYFKTITQVAVSGDSSAVTVGPVGADGAVSATLECAVNEYGDDYKYLASTNITGSTTFAVETAIENKDFVFSSEGIQTQGSWIADTTHTAKTADFQSLLLLPAQAVRLKLSSWTSGGATLRILERTPTDV